MDAKRESELEKRWSAEIKVENEKADKEALSYIFKIAIPIIGIIAFLYMCSQMGEDPVPSNREVFYKVGETFIVDAGRFTVSSVEKISAETHDTLIVHFDVENISKEEITIGSGMVKLIDNEKRIFDSEWDSSWPGSLNPGIRGSGKVKFEIPKDAAGFMVAFRTDMFDFGGADYGYVKLE